MKLATYRTDHAESFGLVVEGGLLDGRAAWPQGPRSVLELLQAGPDALRELEQRAGGLKPDLPLNEVRLMAPVPQPPKVLGLAVNYVEHHREFDRGHDLPESPHLRTTPRPFLMPGTCVAGPDDTIPWPAYSREIDYEVELAVVIGQTCKDIAPRDAARHVAGYTIANDISARSVTHAEGRSKRPKDDFFDWLHGKWADSFCPMGPFLVTADEIPDPQNLRLQTRVNGELRQDDTTAAMIFSVYELVAFCSRLMTLLPGDVIATGTPSGVGKAIGKLLRAGDRIACTIDAIGTLENTLASEPAEFYTPCRR